VRIPRAALKTKNKIKIEVVHMNDKALIQAISSKMIKLSCLFACPTQKKPYMHALCL
jgi:hypothetical protein